MMSERLVVNLVMALSGLFWGWFLFLVGAVVRVQCEARVMRLIKAAAAEHPETDQAARPESETR